ncbi:hypothetical protein KJ780_03795, partial [Candidatus Micrarchaeota archaeon]|nr:hypothetical protein [Candidatus Micrarchaeota archaeon]
MFKLRHIKPSKKPETEKTRQFPLIIPLVAGMAVLTLASCSTVKVAQPTSITPEKRISQALEQLKKAEINLYQQYLTILDQADVSKNLDDISISVLAALLLDNDYGVRMKSLDKIMALANKGQSILAGYDSIIKAASDPEYSPEVELLLPNLEQDLAESIESGIGCPSCATLKLKNIRLLRLSAVSNRLE